MDDHPTIVIWEQMAAELIAVAERPDAFRDVRVRRLGLRETPRGP
ncbi:hypothetical protein [Streptomyces fuscichromogenes]|nr:hypothetical protein [Streptomyces fuscichromogenes]